MYSYLDKVYSAPASSTAGFELLWHGYRKYELKNHPGNVLTLTFGNVWSEATADSPVSWFEPDWV